MKKLLTILFIFLACQLKAQELKNIQFTQPQEGNIVTITYDLKDNNPYQLYNVEVYYSDNKNKNFIQLYNLQGNVRSGVKAGINKKIKWDAAQEFGSIVEPHVQFKLIAKPLYNAETLAWLKAKDKNSCDSYTLYLKNYPQGDFHNEAKANKEELCKNTFADYTETVNGVAFDMVAIKGGSFTMGSSENEQGSDSDEVHHKVTVSDFYMGKYEVTQAEYEAITGGNPAKNYGIGNKYPVYYVSWYEAIAFCNKLSEKAGLQLYYSIDKNTKDPNKLIEDKFKDKKWTVTTNKGANGYRLSTEAEWEYTARGGIKTSGQAFYKYAGSNNIDEVAWYSKNSDETHPVGIKSPNELGIYDMTGNVYEWCWDRFGSNKSDISINPKENKLGFYRVFRGGSWNSSVNYCQLAKRNFDYPYNSYDYIGLRLSRNK